MLLHQPQIVFAASCYSKIVLRIFEKKNENFSLIFSKENI